MEVSVSLADGKGFSVMWEAIDLFSNLTLNCSILWNGVVRNVYVCIPDLTGKMEVRVLPVIFFFFYCQFVGDGGHLIDSLLRLHVIMYFCHRWVLSPSR